MFHPTWIYAGNQSEQLVWRILSMSFGETHLLDCSCDWKNNKINKLKKNHQPKKNPKKRKNPTQPPPQKSHLGYFTAYLWCFSDWVRNSVLQDVYLHIYKCCTQVMKYLTAVFHHVLAADILIMWLNSLILTALQCPSPVGLKLDALFVHASNFIPL